MKHIVGMSGGIDSQATARWVLNRYPKEDVILLNSAAGRNEHPLTTEFLAWYSANVHPVIEVIPLVKDLWRTEGWAETKGLDGNAELTFGKLIEIKGRPPSRTQQFCTSFLKLYPQKRWTDENVTDAYTRYAGVRRDESPARRNVPFSEWDRFFDCEIIRPVFDFTKQMCFDYCKAHGELVNALYALGFGRVGCAPCINSSKEDILRWATRSPEMIDKVRGWERESGSTFFPPIVPGLKINFVDQVVEWAKTERGGSQYGLKVMYEPQSCESSFGLCE